MLEKIYFLVLVAAILSGCTTARLSSSDDGANREEIITVLKAHPEIILEVLDENSIALYKIVERGALHNARREQEEQWRTELKHPRVPEIDPRRPFLGLPDAPILIVCYSNFQCEFCRQANETMKDLFELYPKKIRFIFKHYPSSDISLKAALYFEAIGEVDPAMAWKFHNRLFETDEGFPIENERSLQNIADSLNLDSRMLARRLKASSVTGRVEKDVNEAEDFGIYATPTFLVNGVLIEGAAPLEAFERLIRLIDDRLTESDRE